MTPAHHVYNIFIIEDNPGDLILIQEFIAEQFASYNLTTARNYKETLTILDQQGPSFDVILLDLSLPDGNGKSLIEDMLSHPNIHAPIIILTGYADVNFSIQSIALGISDYLLKDDLSAVVLHKAITYSKERWENKLMLQESEKKYAALFDLSPQPMWLYDRETFRFIQVNEAAINLYGYEKEQFDNIDPVDLHPPGEREELRETIKYIDKKGLAFSGSFTQIKRNGVLIEVELYSKNLVIGNKNCRIVTVIDVTEKNMAELKLTEAIINTQEEERNTLGSELHDNICQILAGSLLTFTIVKQGIAAPHKAYFEQGINHIKLALEEIRNLSHRLAPAFFDEIDLKDAMLQLLSTFNLDGKMATQLYFDEALKNISLKRELQVNLYRILQEQINNIGKYSKASLVEVSLALSDGHLRFEIYDNGVGFDEQNTSKGIGFANMKRRVKFFSGAFNVESAVGQGCRIVITIPPEQLG